MKFVFAVCCTLFGVVATATNQHLVCKQIEDVFEPSEAAGPTGPGVAVGRRHHGAPGKQGSKGERGSPGLLGPVGPKGEPGIVDYGRVSGAVAQEIQTEISKLRAEMQEELQSRKGFCKIMHKGKCFWLVRFEEKLNLAESSKRCAMVGGRAADVEDRAIYDFLVTYARVTYLGSHETYADFWTGMEYNPQTKNLIFANGTSSSFREWHPGTPNGGNASTKMLIRVRKDPGNLSRGMHNWSPTSSAGGIICQFD